MGFAVGTRGKRPVPVMNVTPLVDVVLVLLIIFMVVVPMMEKGARVELAAILNVDPDHKGKTDPITLSIGEDGGVYLERDALDDAGIERALRRVHDQAPTRRIVLRADRGVRYERARALFATCQRIGFPGVALQVNAQSGAHGAARTSAAGAPSATASVEHR